MSKLFRRFLILLLSLTVAFVTVACDCNGCSDDSDSSGGGNPEIETLQPPAPIIDLVDTKELIIGDSYYLNPSIKNVDGDVVWRSSNESVATVNDGVIEALAEGTAVISASYDGVSDECQLTVGYGGLLPDISTYSGIDDDSDGLTTFLVTGSSYSISPYVLFNNKAFADGSFEYTSSTEGIVSISDSGVITPNTVGSTVITVTGSWRGKPILKQFSVEVRSNVNFLIDEGVLQNFVLDTPASFLDDGEYINSITLNPSVSINGGDAVNVDNVAIIATDNTVSYVYDEDTTEYTVNTFGTVLVKLSYFYEADGVTYEANFNITAIRPTKTLELPVEQFCAIGGIYKDGNVSKTLVDAAWGEGASIELYDAYQDGEPVKFVGEKIYGVSVASDNYTDTVVTIGTKTEVYNIPLKEAAGYYLYTKEDVYDCFQIGDKLYNSTGYVVMMNDIDLEGNVSGATPIKNVSSSINFASTFDGKGHVFNNVYIYGGSTVAYGFFGYMSSGSVIKNFAMLNIKTEGYSSRSGIISGAGSDGSGVLLENVYLEYSENISLTSGMFEQFRGTMNNVIVNALTSDDFTIENYVNGSNMTTGASPIVRTQKKLIENAILDNVYLISKKPVFYYAESDSNKLKNPILNSTNGSILNVNDHFIYGENETKLHYVYDYFTRTDNFGLGLTNPTVQNTVASGKSLVLEGIRRYDDYKQLASDLDEKHLDNVDAMSESPYWQIVNGVPVWKAIYENKSYYNEDWFDGCVGDTLALDTVEVYQGGEYPLSVKAFGEDIENVTFTSGDASKATIDGSTLKPIKVNEGENDVVTITANFTINGRDFSVDFNVIVVDPYQLTVDGEVLGATEKLAIDGEYELGIIANGEVVSATFTSSATDVLELVSGSNTNMKAKAIGSSVITATYLVENVETTKEFTVNVNDPVLDYSIITINGNEVENASEVSLVLDTEYTASITLNGVAFANVTYTEVETSQLSITGSVIKPISYVENATNVVNVSFEYNNRTYNHLSFVVEVTHTCNFEGEWLTQSPASITDEGVLYRCCTVDGCTIKEYNYTDKIALKSLEITTDPDKVQYALLEVFDKTGMIVTATGVDDSTADVTALATITCDAFDTAGEYVVTVTFGDLSDTVTVTVIDNALSVSQALEQEVGAEITIRGYFVGVTNFNQDDRLQDGTYTNTYLLVKDTENDNIIAIRHEFAKFVLINSNTDPWQTDIGYTYGDMIVLAGTITAGDQYNTSLRYLDYADSNPENIEETIISRGNEVTYSFEDAVVLDEWADWETAFTDIKPMTYIRITGTLYSIRSNSSYGVWGETDSQARMRTRENRLYMNAEAASWADITVAGRYVTLIDNVMTTNLGSSWTSSIPYSGAASSASWGAARIAPKDVDMYVLYTGSSHSYYYSNRPDGVATGSSVGDLGHHQVVVLDSSWFTASAFDVQA